MSSAIKAISLIKLIFSLYLIINCTCTEVATQVEQPATNLSSNFRIGRIKVTVDNVLVMITRNGQALNLSGAGVLNDWTKVKTVRAVLRSGDFIAITGRNSGVYSPTNPGAMMATITYRDRFGNMRTVNTNNRWRCNFRTARQLGANNNPNTIWFKNINGPIVGINNNAQWIWSRNLAAPRVTCSIRLA
jgi:hypothetical protein